MGIRTTVIAVGAALALVGAGLVVPPPAMAGSVTIESHRSGGGRSWSGEPRGRDGHHGRRGDHWDRRGHGRDRHDGHDGRRGHYGDHGRHGYGHHGGHHHHGWHGWHGSRPYHGRGWVSAPTWIPPRWEWNGWGWVFVPGYWY